MPLDTNRGLKERTALAKTKLIWTVAFVAWLSAMGAGMSVLICYSNTPGALGQSPSTWPLDCAINRSADRNTLLMFVHPRCPCSRASVRELARAMAQCADCTHCLETWVCFFQPVGQQETWARTALWEAAARIPGVSVRPDVGAVTANQFSAKISGHVLLYDVQGRLLFSGGITAGRGHEGDNAGRSAIVSLVCGRGMARKSHPVFGCPMVQPPRMSSR
jgi:hypothetical protein